MESYAILRHCSFEPPPSLTTATDSWQLSSPSLSLSLRTLDWSHPPARSGGVGCLVCLLMLACVSCPSLLLLLSPPPRQPGPRGGAICQLRDRQRGPRRERGHGWRAGKPTHQTDIPPRRACRISLIDGPPPPPAPRLEFGNGRRSVSVVVWWLKGHGYYPALRRGDGVGRM
ncbi:hypothetical protein LZ30DRAFT_129360 [Colletotrichum cereale]|nr:hypothetical protein LZ30DRAFT_129360 [Colletotrichum cereale]